jgi:hypothetical protein
MIVVTLVGVVLALVARSRNCAARATWHRQQLPLPSAQADSPYTDWLREHHARENLSPHLRRQRALLDLDEEWNRFHEESSLAYERVSKMPWLPVSLPTPPPQTPP